MTSAADRVPAPVLVLLGIVSVQFGGALAATLVPVIGAGGSVVVALLAAIGPTHAAFVAEHNVGACGAASVERNCDGEGSTDCGIVLAPSGSIIWPLALMPATGAPPGWYSGFSGSICWPWARARCSAPS